jgi:uncharacterized protein YndB with AHSA1/START domain
MLRVTALFVVPVFALTSVWGGEKKGESLRPPLDASRAVYTTEISASVKRVWRAFTQEKDLRGWMAPLVALDFRVGGTMRSNYNAKGRIGDERTIENTILSYDPEHMLSLKATGFPKDFPFKKVAKSTWTVFYFEPLAKGKTKLTIVGLGYTKDPKSQKMRSFFKGANQYSIEQLKKWLKKASNKTPKKGKDG